MPLNYTSTWEAKYVYYSLDNSKNYTYLTRNTTLAGLSEGQHRVIIRAINDFSIYSENTVYFEVNTAKPERPLALGNQTIALGIVVGVIVVVAVTVVVVMLYKKRSKVNDGIG